MRHLFAIAAITCSCAATPDRPPANNEFEVIQNTTDSLPVPKGELGKAAIVKGDAFEPEEFLVRIAGQSITVNFAGHLISGPLNRDLGFDPLYYVRNVHFADMGKNLVFFFEITNDDWSIYPVVCLERTQLRDVWRMKLSGPITDVGRAEHHILYLAGDGKAIALDTRSGHIVWESEPFIGKGLNRIETISLTEREVRLTGKSATGSAPKTVRLKKSDGLILD